MSNLRKLYLPNELGFLLHISSYTITWGTIEKSLKKILQLLLLRNHLAYFDSSISKPIISFCKPSLNHFCLLCSFQFNVFLAVMAAHSMNIMQDSEFLSANKMFEAKCKLYTKEMNPKPTQSFGIKTDDSGSRYVTEI